MTTAVCVLLQRVGNNKYMPDAAPHIRVIESYGLANYNSFRIYERMPKQSVVTVCAAVYVCVYVGLILNSMAATVETKTV